MRSIDIVNFSGKNFLPINPLSPIVHGLYFSNLVPRVLSYLSLLSERDRRENLGMRLEPWRLILFKRQGFFSTSYIIKGCIQDGMGVSNYEKFCLLLVYKKLRFRFSQHTLCFSVKIGEGFALFSDKILVMQRGTKTAFVVNVTQKYVTLNSTPRLMQVGESYMYL